MMHLVLIFILPLCICEYNVRLSVGQKYWQQLSLGYERFCWLANSFNMWGCVRATCSLHDEVPGIGCYSSLTVANNLNLPTLDLFYFSLLFLPPSASIVAVFIAKAGHVVPDMFGLADRKSFYCISYRLYCNSFAIVREPTWIQEFFASGIRNPGLWNQESSNKNPESY